MGFFTEIIGNSKKNVGRMAVQGTVPVPPAATRLPASHVLSPAFWEGEVGRRGAALTGALLSEPDDRQVVGPSLSENTEESDLAKAPDSKPSTPVFGKRKQAGLKNRCDGIVHSRINREPNLHGTVSFGEAVYRSKDSSVVKPVSKRLERAARGKPANVTFGSRQAGRPTRAGTTTPPFPPPPGGPESVSTPPIPTFNGQASDRETHRSLPLSTATPQAMDAQELDAFRPGQPESLEKRSLVSVHKSSAGTVEGAGIVFSDLMAADSSIAVKSGCGIEGTGQPSFPTEAAAMQGEENTLDPGSTQEPRIDSLPAAPRIASTSSATTQSPKHDPNGSKVHIGLLEVVVLAPEKVPAKGSTQSAGGQTFASRHYLRNF